MARATQKQFEAELARHAGAALDETCADADYHVDAPVGFAWKSEGVHTLTEPHTNESGQTWKAEVRALLIERMRDGLEPCSDADCDVCRDRRDETLAA